MNACPINVICSGFEASTKATADFYGCPHSQSNASKVSPNFDTINKKILSNVKKTIVCVVIKKHLFTFLRNMFTLLNNNYINIRSTEINFYLVKKKVKLN
jgi:hypothetical protein